MATTIDRFERIQHIESPQQIGSCLEQICTRDTRRMRMGLECHRLWALAYQLLETAWDRAYLAYLRALVLESVAESLALELALEWGRRTALKLLSGSASV